MDPRKLGSDSRKLPLLSSKRSEKSMDGKEKCIHGNEKGMGCCGYDELAVKPATTRPITFGTSIPKVQAKPSENSEPEMGSRPRIQAKAMPQADIQLPMAPQGIPVQGGKGARIPDNNMGLGAQARTYFDSPKGIIQAQAAPQRPRVKAVAMGQETPAEAPAPAPAPPPPTPPSPPQVEAILKREAPPEGITKGEANDLALALNPALENSALALAEGEQCFGVDQSSLVKATGLRDGLVKFATTAPDSARLQIEPADISLMEQVLDCSSIYENKKKADSAKTLAFVAGGLLVGAVVLLVVNS